MSERVCAICGARLNGQRPHAVYCGDAHRREAARVRALAGGEPVNGHTSLAEYLAAPHKRAKWQWRPFEQRRAAS